MFITKLSRGEFWLGNLYPVSSFEFLVVYEPACNFYVQFFGRWRVNKNHLKTNMRLNVFWAKLMMFLQKQNNFWEKKLLEITIRWETICFVRLSILNGSIRLYMLNLPFYNYKVACKQFISFWLHMCNETTRFNT